MRSYNIFDLVDKNYNLEKEVEKISYYVYDDNFFCKRRFNELTGQNDFARNYKFIELCENYLFQYLPNVGTCLSLSEFLGRVNAKIIYTESGIEKESLLNFIEVIENFLFIYNKKKKILFKNYNIQYYEQSYKILGFLLSEIENKLGVSKKVLNNKIILCDNDYKLCEVVDKIDNIDVGWELIKYKRERLNSTGKRKVLKQLDIFLEPLIDEIIKTKEKSSIIYKMAKDLGYLYNNYEIRHSNLNKSSNDYKEFLTKYSEKDFVKVYDLTYNLILDFLIAKDYKSIQSEIDKLKDAHS
ncbi:MAG: hypothetical protein J1G07_00640 [Clostridiales bacterium]|nr:hypothetical protein [Clostridiales bacterium]